VRGDVETVRRHIETLENLAPQWLRFYRQAASATIEMAVKSGRLSRDEGRALVAVVRQISAD
jgi:hypothetical protein